MHNIGIAGLGKLGLTWGLILASKGFKIHGFDVNTESINKLKNGELTICEEGCEDLFKKNKNNLNFYNDINEIKEHLDTIFIVVPSPSLENHKFDSSYVNNVLKSIDKFCTYSDKKKFTNVVITSTIMPGESERMLDELSDDFKKGLKDDNIGLCYNPEFIALGSVVKDMLNPDFILIGAYSEKSKIKLVEIYQKVNGKDIPIKAMSLISAEITKISINTFLTLKISYANTIGLLCDQFENSDKFDVCDAIGSDSRIGNKFLLPGLGFGGPCLPRDTRAFGVCLTENMLPSSLSDSSASVNKLVENYYAEKIENSIEEINIKDPKILFSGITYKKGSWLLEESHSFKIILNTLEKISCEILLFDEGEDQIKTYSNLWQMNKNNFKILSNDIEKLLGMSPDILVLSRKMEKDQFFLINQFMERNENVHLIDLTI